MLELIVTKQFRRDLIRAYDVISNQQPYVNPNAAKRLSVGYIPNKYRGLFVVG